MKTINNCHAYIRALSHKRDARAVGMAAARANLYLCLLLDDAVFGGDSRILTKDQFDDVVAALHWEIAQTFDCPAVAWHSSDCHVCCVVYSLYALIPANSMRECAEFLTATREDTIMDIAQRVRYDLRQAFPRTPPRERIGQEVDRDVFHRARSLVEELTRVKPRLSLHDIQELPSDVEPEEMANRAEELICPRDTCRLKILPVEEVEDDEFAGWEDGELIDKQTLFDEIERRLDSWPDDD